MGSQAGAYTTLEPAKRVIQAVPFSEFYATRDQRVEMAAGIVEYWEDFNSRLPRLSPSELEWLTTELHTTDIVRLGRAYQTREFHLWQLANLADQCTSAANNLVAALNTAAQYDTEMFHWTKVASCYHESDGSIFDHLRAARLDETSDEKDGFLLDHMILSKVLNVIIPSAMVDTMGWTLNKD